MNFFQRIGLALSVALAALKGGTEAERLAQLLSPKPTSPELPAGGIDGDSQNVPERTAAALPHPDALLLLSIFQREGRLVDFLQEDIGGFSDEQVGAAARAVHAGCRKALLECVPVQPIFEAGEGSSVSVEAAQAGSLVTLTGNLTGKPPFKGILCHRGWKAQKVTLPETNAARDMTVIAPAEVEL